MSDAFDPSTIKLAPSILAADFSRLGEQLRAAEAGGADYIHVDIMDGHFVPNLSMGPVVVEACKQVTELPLDVHLMIEVPERFIERFAQAGAANITVHAEATPHVHRALQIIRESGTKVGLCVNPLTPLSVLEDALPLLDLALIMGVNPGFGGQTLIPATLSRLRHMRARIAALNPSCELEIDGGVVPENIQEVAKAGANVIVAGSAVFGGSGAVEENIAALRANLSAA